MGQALVLPGVRPACQEPSHTSWRPLHEEIYPFIFNRDKAQPFIEPQGRVELLHMDAHGLVGGGGFGQEVAQDGGADPGVAVGRQQGDIDNADLILPAGDIEAPDGHRVAQNDEKVRLGVAFLVKLVLRCELLVQKGGFVCLVSIDHGQLVEPRASIHLGEECCVISGRMLWRVENVTQTLYRRDVKALARL